MTSLSHIRRQSMRSASILVPILLHTLALKVFLTVKNDSIETYLEEVFCFCVDDLIEVFDLIIYIFLRHA